MLVFDFNIVHIYLQYNSNSFKSCALVANGKVMHHDRRHVVHREVTPL